MKERHASLDSDTVDVPERESTERAPRSEDIEPSSSYAMPDDRLGLDWSDLR